MRVSMQLSPDGNIVGPAAGESPAAGSDGTQRALSSGALRAAMRSARPTSCRPRSTKPGANVVVNFDPSQMF
jgi:hypothetical protein